MSLLLAIVIFLIIINFLVFVHEFGHFAMAKLFKIKVYKFALGFGPNIVAKKIGETEYQLNWIPFGGFVQLEGEEDEEVEDGFRSRGVVPKLFVLFGGIAMNLLVAVVFFQISLVKDNYNMILPSLAEYEFHGVESQEEVLPLLVTEVIEDSPSIGQIEENEIITAIDGVRFRSFEEFQEVLAGLEGQTVTFEFLSYPDENEDGDYIFYEKDIVVGEKDPETGAILGVSFAPPPARTIYYMKYNENLGAGVLQAYDLSVYQFKVIGELLGEAIENQDVEEASKVFVGPVGVGNSVNQIVEFRAFDYLIFFTALLSLSLAIFNLLPIPALDGGQAMIVIIEFITRKKFSNELINKINTIGFFIIIAFAVIVMIKDLFQFEIIDSIINGIQSALGR